MITVLHDSRESVLPQARSEGESLWLGREDIERATGWSWKTEGLCLGDICIPIPPAKALVANNQLDLAGLWRHLDQPVAHDSGGSTWVLGTAASERAQSLASLQAPDFELPDLDGKIHRLSDYRGKKVFLATWASW